MKKLTFVSALAFMLVARPSLAIQLDDPTNFQVVQIWRGVDFGVPGRLGGLLFSEDGQTLFAVGNAEASDSALYALPVSRDPSTGRILSFGAPTLVFAGTATTPGLDAGLERGPEGTLFYTYWSAHKLGERPEANPGVETMFDMTPTGVPSSVAGLAFSPFLLDANSGFQRMQVSSWLGDGVYDVPLTPRGGGIFEPGAATLFVRLPQEGTGAIQYVPRGLYTGNLMYVNWNFGEVRMLVIDSATGLPINDVTGLPERDPATPRDIRFASDMGVGPWGLEFDPLTLDFLVSTWNGDPSNSIIQFSGPGFANQPPHAKDQGITTWVNTPIDFVLGATDPDRDPLSFQIVSPPANGVLTGTTAERSYSPEPGFVGTDHLTFRASDGFLTSNTATVTIVVSYRYGPDAGSSDRGAEPDMGLEQDATELDAATEADSGALDLGARDSEAVSDAGPRPDAGSPGEEEGCDCAAGESRGSSAWSLALLTLVAVRRRTRSRSSSR
ncbi:MAG: Ig-like domain-containing protein [Deltaproteobacteria bacterium]|nr:Ig-like domain-containing protein [Deltaproteobacteria bacterium]